MLVILKIPVVYLCTVVWWAIRAEPRPPEPAVKTVRAEPEPPPGWRFGSATLIQTSNQQLNNKVLLVGGNNGTQSLSSVFLFDPARIQFPTHDA